MPNSSSSSSSSFLFFFSFFFFFFVDGAPIDDEINALIALKQSIVDFEGHLSDWVVALEGGGTVNYTKTPCTWNGVKCHTTTTITTALRKRNNLTTSTGIKRRRRDADIVVEALDLSGMNLSGTISPSIGLLQNLINLSLALNNFSGPIPTQISNIGPSLRLLNLSNNLLTSTLHRQLNFTNLSSLEVLDLYNNNLTGPLPSEVAQLTSLRHLHLGGNYFSGPIPPSFGSPSLSSLSYLALSGNSLVGPIPSELGNLSSLQELYLGYFNQFEGGIPPSLGRLAQLVRLDLAECGLDGNIPRELENLVNLDSLFLQINSLSGPIPPGIGKLTGLKSLDLSNNLLEGHIPLELAKLLNLELLNLFRNQIHGEIPSFIGDLPSLKVLSLWENNMTGVVPKQLGLFQDLVTLDLSSNSFEGPIPPNVCARGQLERLVLFNNHFSGYIPWSLGTNCPNLVRIRLGQNNLSGSIPSGLLSLPSLQILEAPLNQLSGSIPGQIPYNVKLGRLDLSRNMLSNPIPLSLSNLSSLQTLLLQGNMLSSQIPPEISSLKHLSKLDLSANLLNGSIPSSLAQCGDLTYIDLSRNNIQGSIPSSLENLGVLNYLNLSRNQISGAIPPSFQQMQTLTSVDFSYNNLSGVIPEGGQFATFNASSFIGNQELCGVQLQSVNNQCMNSSGDHGRIRSQPALVYWVIVGAISALTVVVFIVGVLYNKQAFCSLLGKDMSTLERSGPWNLVAYQKLDFTSHHVLACLADEDNIIGKGGSGTVYKCETPSGYVAVKRLPSGTYSNVGNDVGNSNSANAHMDDHGFSAEIRTLGKIRHRNIVRLLGCCSSKETNLLVYEYMPNGSLGELLHGPKGGSLDWEKRYKIAVEAAHGLRYLHHDCSPIIVHRDVKSNNILLDSKYEAHVADFGLAKALDYPGSMSSVAGSYGYIAPEYVYTLKVDEKSDIYSFGVVLLELVTGKRPFEPEFGEGVDIAQWVRKKVQTREGVIHVLDKRMNVDLNEHTMVSEIMLVLRVALHCLVDLPMQRPTMNEVVQMLTDHRLPKKSKNAGSNLSSSSSSVSSSGGLLFSQDLGSVSGSVPELISHAPDLISI